jgi:alpha-L-fucosidase 2
MHYWDHYAFSGDELFLHERAWPYFEGASRFWLARLKRLDDGRLVVPNGWSPEHGPREDGVTYDQHLVWELFGITERAGTVLGIARELVERVREARLHLVEPRVGRWGQLTEWMEDRDDPDDQHRHTSHLIGVYPGTRIAPQSSPDLAKAAQLSLAARGESGDSRRSWTWPWRCALWARLGRTDAHRMLDGLVEHNLLPNMVTTHPPLQLDGNFGITAAICEMLLQSHIGEIRCLPAVDLALWPEGSFRGLRARGGFELSARWRLGSLTVELFSRRGGSVMVKAPFPIASVTRLHEGLHAASPVVTSTTNGDGIRLKTQAGAEYLLEFQ